MYGPNIVHNIGRLKYRNINLILFDIFCYRHTALTEHLETRDNQLSFEKGDEIEVLDEYGLTFLERRNIKKRLRNQMYCIYGRNCRTQVEGYFKPSTFSQSSSCALM